jgi:NACHT domain
MIRSGGPFMKRRHTHEVLGLGIIKAAFKAILPGMSTRAEGLADLAAFAFSDPDLWMEQNDFRRQLEAAADLLMSKLAKVTSAEFRELDSGEREIVVGGVAKVVLEADLTKNDLEFNMLLNRDKLFRSLEPAFASAFDGAPLSERAVEYGRILLGSACEYLINLIRALPEFNDEITWQTYVTTRGLSESLQSAIESVILPRFRIGTPREVSEFEAKYATNVVTSLGAMELFGLDLPPELQRQPLSIAYITLTASTQAQVSARFDTLLAALLAEAARSAVAELDAQKKVDRAYARWREGGTAAFDTAAGRLHGPSSGEHEATRRSPLRILITGDPGSGKTTAVRWLAVQIAARKLPQRLSMLSSDLPLFVPLRHVFDGSRLSPAEEDLTSYVSLGRGAEMPGGWLNDRLRSGQVLLIFDGIDELSDINRSRAMSWIQSLMSDYPGCDFITTSRPDGYDPAWFDSRDFTNVHLEVMELPDIRNCITAWFDALRQGVSLSDWDRYEQSKRALLADADAKASVRDLAATPLLCAMLCAFYTMGTEETPRSRGDLYRMVIEGLVNRDAVRRGTNMVGGRRFELPEKLSLLQAVAREMVETHRTEIFVNRGPEMSLIAGATAHQIMLGRLAGMLTAGVTADQAARYLTERSVVFRLIAPNLAQFAHRTFQEYLAARDFALGGRVENLLRHVSDKEWHQIFAFAAGAAPTDVASRLVDEILSAAMPGSPNERERLMLAAECLTAAAPGVSPSVAEKARSAIARMLPPRTTEEAVLSAAFGEGILPWLEVDESRPIEISDKCVHAAAMIGGSEALNVIAGYSQSGHSAELEEVLTAEWYRFAPEDYAIRVLSNCELDSTLRISQGSVLQAVRLLPQVQKIRVDARDGLTDLTSWASLTELQELDFGGLPSLLSIRGVGALVGLQRLNLSGIPAVDGFEELGRLNRLTELHLNRCTGLTDPTPLAKLHKLRILHIAGCANVTEFEWIMQLGQLWNLDLSGTRASDISFCSSLVNLRRLLARVTHGVSGSVDLSKVEYLRELTLKFAHRHEWVLPHSGTLQKISLSGYVIGDDLTVLARVPSLRSLSIEDGSRLSSLESLQSHPSLTHLTIGSVSGTLDVGFIATLKGLRSLELPDSGIETLDFLRGMSQLRHLVVDGCRNLEDIRALGSLSSLQYVSLGNGVHQVDEVVLSAIAKRVGFQFDFDPYHPDDYIGASA